MPAELATRPVLTLNQMGVAYGQRVILLDVNLHVPAQGVLNLMGPGGSGKSSLLRVLGGLSHCYPYCRQWGTTVYRGLPLADTNRPAVVWQKSRFILGTVVENLLTDVAEEQRPAPHDQRRWAANLLREAELEALIPQLTKPVATLAAAQQRQLMVARALVGNPDLICVDEITAGLSDEAAVEVLRTVASIARKRAVLFVTHNRLHAQRLGGDTALLAGGQIQAQQPTVEFFTNPAGEAAKTYVRTGGCPLPSPSTPREALSPEAQAWARNPRIGAEVSTPGPGLVWVERGRLAALLPNPLGEPTEDSGAALARFGITRVVALVADGKTPHWQLPTVTVDANALAGGGVPLQRAVELLESLIAAGEVVCLTASRPQPIALGLLTFLVARGVHPLGAAERVRTLLSICQHSLEDFAQLLLISESIISDVSPPVATVASP